MLGKLIRYEFRSTAKYYLPIYLALVILSLLTAMLQNLPAQKPFPALVAMSVSIYALFAVALAAVTFVAIIIRFYRNLLGAEGYLMFTLPVTASQNILGKLIPAVCWGVGSVLLGILTILPMVNGLNLKIFLYDMANFFSDGAVAILTIGGIITLILMGAGSILFLYLCMSIGQLFNEHKFLASVGTYLVLQTVSQILGIVFIVILGNASLEKMAWLSTLGKNFILWMENSPILGASVISLVMIAVSFLICLVLFLITRWLLEKKLNLA